MARRKRSAPVGAERARQQLPELLDRAHRGEATIITKHGKPYAALVPLDQHRSGAPVSLTSLRGTGKGMWGEVGEYVGGLRDEWA